MIVKDFVIIGGGIAGLSAIKSIREEDTESSVLWITDEDRLPYKRTKINKNIVSGFGKEDFALIDHDWLVNNHVELLYDRVENIDVELHELAFKHRGHLRYKKLILATGNKPNQLLVDNLPEEKIFHVHTARQVENIIRFSKKSIKYLIIGAGVEGVETADQLIKMNKEVVLIDRNNTVIKRFLNQKYSDFLVESIKKSGIEFYPNITELNFSESESGKSILTFDDKKVEFDALILTLGYTPNTDLAVNAELKCNTGILVNEYLQTSNEDIYAAGDVAEHVTGQITGLWHAAERQGYIAGKNAMGKEIIFKLEPFRMKTEVFDEFYFSVKPQGDEDEVVTEEKDTVVRDIYIKDGKVLALFMKNDGARAKLYQQAIMEQWEFDKFKNEIPL
ncbi:NAD(P)/FAD-dependent oxidoreductase [Plebeiibacterium sediminum]|uniref:NAD(P)/FAD-dependent oxidoreductase n=1 Tax=Plebeiibacterium sediminum TaxID=2992112 RepID=A0AAE3SFE0_9BACT|nr:NAD(P)/FAD-dependent oxidoreductase [Plebeiobacterium sediminum]MCW3787395.1 NAD(P)/FAD-dependent oxidoreductase [Plebeiobacterium sediminum]